MTAPRAPRTVVHLGITLVLAGTGYMGFVHKWEDGPQMQTIVYADNLAGGLPTACGGVTKHTSPVPVIVGEIWSAEKCAEVGRMVAEKTQLKLLDCVSVPIRQTTFDALSSHAHNFGVANTCASRALALINAGRLEEGCRALAFSPAGAPVWSYVDDGEGGKKFVPGLHARRKDEMTLCTKP